jgi:protoporphyrin/coproporphyrin ferrochelatase
LIAALQQELAAHGPHLPIYWGNRNWHPLLADTLREMRDAGVKRALAFFTSAFSSYSGCRQYRENIAAAQQEVGEGAPQVDKLRVFFNHPGYIEPVAENARAALAQVPAERRAHAKVLFTAHSIPMGMADNCRYVPQLQESCRLVAESVGSSNWQLVYQSRSGPPTQPWLEPDVLDVLRTEATAGTRDIVIVPIGFISDHMEVLYDLDTEAKDLARELGIHLVRAATVGTHPRFIRMIRELIVERMSDSPDRVALGTMGPSHDVCPVDCCLYTPRRPI